MKDRNTAFNELPLVAILRGLSTDQAVAVGGALVDAGFRIIEVPLNSPDPLRCISVLAEEFGDQALIGAGTVLSADDIRAVGRCRWALDRIAALRSGRNRRLQGA